MVKNVPSHGEVTVGVLTVPPEIDAENTAIRVFRHKAPNAVGIAFHIDPSGPGPPSLGKNEDLLAVSQEVMAGGKGLFHLFTVAAAIDGQAFRQIA
jgi:hypothetical protein